MNGMERKRVPKEDHTGHDHSEEATERLALEATQLFSETLFKWMAANRAPCSVVTTMAAYRAVIAVQEALVARIEDWMEG